MRVYRGTKQTKETKEPCSTASVVLRLAVGTKETNQTKKPPGGAANAPHDPVVLRVLEHPASPLAPRNAPVV